VRALLASAVRGTYSLLNPPELPYAGWACLEVGSMPDPDSCSAAKDAVIPFTRAYCKARCLAATYDPLLRAARK
jgi:hypothetical protein